MNNPINRVTPSGERASARSSRRAIPGPWIWLSIAVLVGLAWYFYDHDRDPSINRLLVAVVCLVSSLLLWCWFVFRSSHAGRLKQAVFWLPLLLLALIVGMVRVERITGGLGMEFAWRWSSHPDQQLESLAGSQPPESAANIDTTTPLDFPQFLGPDRNSVVTTVRLDPDWTAHPPRVIWRQPMGAGCSSFAVVNDVGVTMEQRGDAELVTCYAVDSGQLLWAHAVQARHETKMGYIGPRSTPTIFGGRIYALGATGVFRCLDGGGNAIWQRDLFADYGFTAAQAEREVAWGRANSPLVVDDLVIVPLGGVAGSRLVGLVALDLQTGETRWESGPYQASYASPGLAELRGVRQILSVNEDVLSSHDPSTGDVLWEFPWPGKSNTNANVSQPNAIDGDRVLLTKGYGTGAELLEVNHIDGEWSVESLWKNARAMKTKFSNVAIRNGHAFGLDDGVLSCIDLDTGDRRWKKGRFGFGQVLLVGKHLLLLGEHGELAVVAADPDRYQELGVIQALDGQTWCNPVLYGSHLLIRNFEEAACYELSHATGAVGRNLVPAQVCQLGNR